ncbi:hypothetical protein TNCV_3618891 [Trichonephila clavipes]|nr:hypothetical protein TNCV_3618891 [Trichonephila clavipes]
MAMMQDSESDVFSDSVDEEVVIGNSGSNSSLCSLHFVHSTGGSQSHKQFIMELVEKVISENHRDEFSSHQEDSVLVLHPLG